MLNSVHIPLNIKTIKKSNRGKYTLNFPQKSLKSHFSGVINTPDMAFRTIFRAEHSPSGKRRIGKIGLNE